MKANILRNPYFFAALLLLSVGFVYGGQWGDDLFLNYDDSLVLEPMRGIASFHDYLSAFFSGKIVDVQPVRDFITALDFFIFNTLNLSVFHLTNVFIWLGTLWGLRKLIAFVREPIRNGMLAILLLLAVNPLYVTSVSWLSARKHLLASCFIVWASYYFLTWLKGHCLNRKPLIFSYLFYILAIFSQPIVLFWPFCAALMLYFESQRKQWRKILPLFGIMLGVAWLNSFYYSSGLYFNFSHGVSKFSEPYNSIVSIRLFAIGRYFFQVLVPYWTSIAVYDLGSWRGLLGIFLLPISAYIFLKTAQKYIVAVCFAFFILLLMPVVLRMTQIFGIDTYVLSASFGIYFLIALATLPWLQKKKKFSFALWLILFISFSFLSKDRAGAFDSDVHVFTEAWKLEKSIGSGEDCLHALVEAKRDRESIWYAQDVLEKYPNSIFAQGLIARAIARDPDLSIEQKIDKIYDYHFLTSQSLEILAGLEFQLKNYRSSEQLLLKVLDSPEWAQVFAAAPEYFAARIFVSCLRGENLDCENKAGRIRLKVLPAWNQSLYETEKKKIGSQ